MAEKVHRKRSDMANILGNNYIMLEWHNWPKILPVSNKISFCLAWLITLHSSDFPNYYSSLQTFIQFIFLLFNYCLQ